MTYHLLLAGRLGGREQLVAALAALAAVPVEAVEVVSEADVNSPDRNWAAPVSCVLKPLAGDVAWGLEINLTDETRSELTEGQVAAYLAHELGLPVLYSAQSYPPSAYWLTAPGGLRTRARLDEGEDVDPPVYTIDAVELRVRSLPGVRVAAQPEVIRQHRMTTPVADELNAWLTPGADDVESDKHLLWLTRTRLRAWEGLIVRMGAGWPPDGWYPADFYREDLEVRDELAAAVARLPRPVADRVAVAMAQLDGGFRARTREVDDSRVLAQAFGPGVAMQGRAWWWRRLPEPQPWRATPGRVSP